MYSPAYSVDNSPLNIKSTNSCFHLPPFSVAFPETLLLDSPNSIIERVQSHTADIQRLRPMTSERACASLSPVHQQATKPTTSNWSHQFINFTNCFPNLIVKKRARSKFEEVKRLYPCKHPNCNKTYGALNHLNAHIVSKNHGPKRSPLEFQELRKAIKLRII